MMVNAVFQGRGMQRRKPRQSYNTGGGIKFGTPPGQQPQLNGLPGGPANPGPQLNGLPGGPSPNGFDSSGILPNIQPPNPMTGGGTPPQFDSSGILPNGGPPMLSGLPGGPTIQPPNPAGGVPNGGNILGGGTVQQGGFDGPPSDGLPVIQPPNPAVQTGGPGDTLPGSSDVMPAVPTGDYQWTPPQAMLSQKQATQSAQQAGMPDWWQQFMQGNAGTQTNPFKSNYKF